MKAQIWFDWSNWLYVNGKQIRQCTDAEMYKIGFKLGWYQ